MSLHHLSATVSLTGLLDLAHRRGLLRRSGPTDLGYATHMLLRETWPSWSLGTFAVLPHPEAPTERMTVQAYILCDEATSPSPGTQVHPPPTSPLATMLVRSPAEPSVSLCPVTSWSSPTEPWCFRVRACPVRRTQQPGGARRNKRELDAWHHACQQEGRVGSETEPVLRLAVAGTPTDVYRAWLRERLGSIDGLEVLQFELEAMTPVFLTRRTQDIPYRQHTRLRRTAVDFSGSLLVRDASVWRQLLQRGIGRHRSFGFGMLRGEVRGPTVAP